MPENNNSPDKRPIIMLAEDEEDTFLTLMADLILTIPDHHIHLQTEFVDVKSDILRFTPKVLILDRGFFFNKGDDFAWKHDAQGMAENFRRDYPSCKDTAVIVYSQWGDSDYVKRFNFKYNGQGIYYIQKLQGNDYLIDFIENHVLPQWPAFPTHLP
jgi:hypothetical protein